MNPNPYFVGIKIIKYQWGNDSRYVIFIYGLKSWNDIEPAFKESNEILKAHKGCANDQDVEAFKKLWSSLFMNDQHHSDEICQVVEQASLHPFNY